MKVTRHTIALALTAALVVPVLTACEDTTTTSSERPTLTATPTPTESKSDADKAFKDAQKSNEKNRKSLESAIAEASKSAKAKAEEKLGSKVPDVVGMTNAEAIPTLHEAGFMANEEDATGQNRWSLDNSNWKVCSQDPGPGATAALRVAIYSVKLNENC